MRSSVFLVLLIKFVVQVICYEPLLDFVNFQDKYPYVSLSENCAKDLTRLKNGIEKKEIWAKLVQDVSGRDFPGLLRGNNFWVGLKESCNLMNNPVHVPLYHSDSRISYENLTDIPSEIEVEYRMFYVNHSSPMQFDYNIYRYYGLYIGLCFPKRCNINDIDKMSHKVFDLPSFNNEGVHGETKYLRSKNLELRKDFFFDPFVIMLLLTVVIFGLLVIIGTIIVDIKNKSEDFEQLKNEKKESSFWNLVAIQENFSYLITTEVPKNAFTSIYGLRAISMLWVIAGHNTLYAMIITDNQQLMFETYGHYLNSFISTSIIIADFFFVFGGFLLSYSFFEQMKKVKPKNLITFCFDRIVKRYIRLNPPFIIIIVMSIVLGIYLNDTSSFILYEDLEGNCKQYWWRNLLLIQNWFSRHEMCMSWSWFVAADFQLYAFTTLMLAVYIKNEKLGKFLFSFVAIASAAYCAYWGVQLKFNIAFDAVMKTSEYLYLPPYTRVGCYFLGVYCGYFLSKNNKVWNVSDNFIQFGWAFTGVSVLGIIYFFEHLRSGYLMSLLGSSIGRTVWCSFLAFMILATCTQHGDVKISRFFKHEVFYFFHRTSFTCYILNPLVVMVLLFSCEFPIHFDIASLIPFVNGLYCLTIIASVVFSVMIEFPLSRMIDFALKKITKSPSVKSKCNDIDDNGNKKDLQLTSVKTNL